MKRLFDILGASVLFVLSLPIFVLAALAVWVSSGGPVFFGHWRVGKGGRRFRCWKLRTMVPDAEAWLERDANLKALHRTNGFKLPRTSDPRITRVGHFLRFTHLDELPQLFNVLRGEMSLVGPRPVVEEELEWYGDRKAEFLSVRPGIFGEWTARGKRRPDYPERVEVELSYVRNRRFLKDAVILLRNIPVLVVGQSEDEGEVQGGGGGVSMRVRHPLVEEASPLRRSFAEAQDPSPGKVAVGGKR